MTGDFYTGASEGRSNVPAVFRVPVSERLGAEYVPLMQDALRMLCIQATVQLLGVLSQPAGSGLSFFTAEFVLLLIYVILGVMLYWLAVRRMVAFV